MKTKYTKLILFILIFSISCSSSGEEEIIDLPPGNPNPANAIVEIVHDQFEGIDYIVVGSESLNFMLAYNRSLNGNLLNFEALQDILPIVMQDNLGNRYDIFGEIKDGPNLGEKLSPVNAFIGYWFSWGTFFPGLEIYDNTQAIPNLGESVQGSDDWLIPKNQVFQGAARDAIPAIDSPKYDAPKNDDRNENELVIGVRVNNKSKAYPHAILNWHEIVNDNIDETYYSVVFCPLTGTATTWNRKIGNQVTSFGVSGFLYNSNVVPYDRNTNSNWSQMLQQSVQGTLSGQKSKNLFVMETTLSTWKIIGNSSNLLSTDTGYNRDYNRNPYGDYPTNSTISFPINFEDNRLHAKERVLGVVINGKAKAYRYSTFR